MPSVFVSHSSRDHHLVYPRIIQVLDEHGLATFYSRDSIHGAQEWEKRIRQGLESCPWFLVALSENSVQSEWVQAEVGWALTNRRGRLVPVLVGDCNPEDCNLRLRQIQYVDLREDTPAAREKLLETLLRPEGDETAAEDGRETGRARPSPSRGRSSRQNRAMPWLIAAGALVALAGIVYGAWGWINPGPKPPVNNDHSIAANDEPDSELPSPAADPPPPPPVAISVGLDKDVLLAEPEAINAGGHPKEDPFAVSYDYDSREGALIVQYTMPYLETVRKGGPIFGVAPRPYDWAFPKLSVKALNNSPRTLLLTECVIEVAKSTVNDEPLITVADESFNHLIFLNDGWGPVIDPVLAFKLLPPNGEEGDLLFAPKSVAQSGETFEDVWKLPIVKHVPDHLADYARVLVEGVLQYGPADARKSLQFATLVNLESYPGDPSPPTREYDVMLVAGEAPKTIRRPIAQEIKAGDSDQFLLRIGSDKSAHYELTLKYIGADERVLAEKKVSLDIFVPRMAAKLIEEAQPRNANDGPTKHPT